MISMESTTFVTNFQEGVFKIKKLGKKEFTQKERLLELTPNGVSYYALPQNNSMTKDFYDRIKEIYNPREPRADDTVGEVEEQMFKNLLISFKVLQTKKLIKKKDEIAFEELDAKNNDLSSIRNPKNFKICYELRQVVKDSKVKVKGKGNVLKHWTVEFYEKRFLRRFRRILDIIISKKTQPKEIPIPPKIVEEKKPEKKEEIKKEEVKENIPDIEPDIIQTLYYIEAVFQYLLRQYYQVNVLLCKTTTNSQLAILKLKYELTIYQICCKFKELCIVIVKKIVNDLYVKPFALISSGTFTPIVIPSPPNFKRREQAVLLYNIFGINLTLTWHQLQLNKDNSGGLIGAWYELKSDFKNRDFFQDLIMKISSEIDMKGDFPRYPLSCLIDYCGFRVLCENDIYIDDGALACGLNKEGGSNYLVNSTQKEDIELYKNIAQLMSNDIQCNFGPQSNRLKTLSTSSNLNDCLNPNPEVVFPVHVPEKKESSQKQLCTFMNVLKSYSKKFNDISDVILSPQSPLKNFLFPESSIDSGNNIPLTLQTSTLTLNVVDNNINPVILTKEKDNDIIDTSLKEYFELANKDLPSTYCASRSKELLKQSIKYIMDFKVLVEMKEKEKPKSVNTNPTRTKNISEVNSKNVVMSIASSDDMVITSQNTRSHYFRPEFLIKYIDDSLTGNIGADVISRIKRYIHLDTNNTSKALKYFKEEHISYLINSLDSMFFKPYDSETLSEVFHIYGVNMTYLGIVAELTSVPHVRELCLIDMIARVCKGFIYDMISIKAMEKAFEDFFTNQIPADTQGANNFPNNQYLQYVPVSFMIKYHRDYLKKLLTIGKDQNYSYHDDTVQDKNKSKTITGLYRKWWYKCNDMNKENDLKILFETKDKQDSITFIKPLREKTVVSKAQILEKNSNTAANSKQFLSDATREVVKFLTVLFNTEQDKFEVEIYGEKYKSKALWEMIINQVKSYWSIENKEVFLYCDLEFISVPGLLSAIQYHSGISIKLEKSSGSPLNILSEKDILNREFVEANIDFYPTVQSYSFRYFETNKNKIDTLKNDYCLVYVPTFSNQIHKAVLLRFYSENIQKNLSNYTRGYLYYLNAIQKWDDYKTQSEWSIMDTIYQVDYELRDHLKDITGDMIDYKVYHLLANAESKLKFECFHFYLAKLIEAADNEMRLEREASSSNVNGFINNAPSTLLKTASPSSLSESSSMIFAFVDKFISTFWSSKHPYICLLNLIYAKLLLKIQQVRKWDDNIDKCFKTALAIARDSFGPDNLFYGNIAMDLGLFYISEKKYFEACKHLSIAYTVFNEHKSQFFVDYMRVLKKLTKYNVILGHYQEAFSFGSELITSYLSYKVPKMILNGDKVWENYNIKAIIFNLIKIAKTLGKNEEGVEMIRILLYENIQPNEDSPEIKKFRNWKHVIIPKREKKVKNSKGFIGTTNITVMTTPQQILLTSQNLQKAIRLMKIYKLYLTLIIRTLSENDRLTYILALVKLTQDKKEYQTLELYRSDPEYLFEEFYRNIKDEGVFSKFFVGKILHHLGQKFLQEKEDMELSEVTQKEIQSNYEKYWEYFKKLYKIFQGSGIFNSFCGISG